MGEIGGGGCVERGVAPRRRRARATLLVAALALVAPLSACDAGLLNVLVDSYVDGADANELNGGDNVTSIALGDDRSLLLINDPFVGPVNPDGTRQSGYLVNNALVVFDHETGGTQTLLGPNRTARFKPASSNHYYWLSHGVREGTTIHLLLQERVASTWEIVANAVISLSLPTFTQTGSTVTLPASDGKPAWGTTILTIGSHHYLYGLQPQDVYTLRTVVARVPTGSLRTLSSWRYWTGTGWSTSQSSAVPLIDEHGAPLPFLVSSMVVDGGLVTVGSGTVFSDRFIWAASDGPVDPYTVGATAYAPPEAHSACGVGATEVVYGAVPHVASPADASLWSYGRNCWAIPPDTPSAQVEDYQPQFINLDLGDAPDPCPAPTSTVSDKLIKAAYADFLSITPLPADLTYWRNHIATTGYCDTP
ncbi:MAG TPA: hypothetical protein VEW93_08285, partial [Acidimicrobiales bacterium]|nr:hypothetical protein [Acidimicrobiales bacterium]